MTDKQIKIAKFLESLVHNRYSMEQLNKALSDFFNTKIKVENNTQIRIDAKDYDSFDDLPYDDNLIFNIEDGTEQSGFYDIYMLPMQRVGFNGEDMYITEVGYEFI